MTRLSSIDLYTKELLQLFKSRGLRMSMDEIARRLDITKKTLYNNFSSRNEMIKFVTKYFFDTLESKISESSKLNANAIEQMINISKTICRECDKLGEVLMDDLVREKPDLFLHSHRTSFYYRLLKENLYKGIEEGLYRKDLDFDYVIVFYTSVLDAFYRRENWARFFKNTSEFHLQLVKHYLYAIVSTESRHLLDSYHF